MLPVLLAGGQIGLGAYGALSSKKAAKKARKEQKKYLAAALAEYDKLAAMYKPTSGYGESLREDLRKQGELDVGKTMQQRLQSGIGGTSYGDVYANYQQNVARPQRMRLEDFLADKYAGVAQQKAQLLGGINVSGPSGSDISSYASQMGQGIGNLASALAPKQTPFQSDLQTSTERPSTPAQSISPLNYLKNMFKYGSKK